MKPIFRMLAVMFICIGITSCESNSTPQITMNPIDDAQTCIKLYEKDAAKGEAYMQEVIFMYYMQDKHDEHDEFASIVTEKIAEMSFR